VARPLLLLPLVLALLLCGCAAPAQPQGEVQGATGIAFAARPTGQVAGTHVVWDVHLVNQDAATSAAARVQLTVTFAQASTSKASADVAHMPAHGTADLQVATPYQGPGDYSGEAEVLVGTRVVARAYLFFEQCAGGC